MKALVTGSGGQVGRHLMLALQKRGDTAVGLPRAALDVGDERAVLAAVREIRPDVIFHCAAWTNVDSAEGDEAGAMRVNGDGTGNVARAGADVGASVVAYSTDYVFDGALVEGYVESSRTAPISAYGRTKLAGEEQALASGARVYVVRTSWVFDEQGKNFVRLMHTLATTRPVISAPDDQWGSPTYAGHLAAASLELVERPEPGIFHLAGCGGCSRFELASAVVQFSGLDCRVERAKRADFPAPAPRPMVSVLRTERPDCPLLPPWREGVASCLRGMAPV
jgi:dTDP-4-dehydrorhamnose reductase